MPPRREEDGVPPIAGNRPLLTCLRSRKMGAMTASASRCCWGDSPGLPRVKCTSHHAVRTQRASAVRSPLDPASELWEIVAAGTTVTCDAEEKFGFFRYCSISEHSVFGDRSHMGHRAISCCSGNDPSRPTGAIPAAPARPRGLPATREAAGRGGPATIANSGPRPHPLNLARAVTRGRKEEEAVVPAHGHCSTHAQCFFFFFQNKLHST